MTMKEAGKQLGKGLVKGTFRGIVVVERGASPRVRAADVVGSKGRVRTTGAMLRRKLGLRDTWAYFTAVSTKKSDRRAGARRRPRPRRPTRAASWRGGSSRRGGAARCTCSGGSAGGGARGGDAGRARRRVPDDRAGAGRLPRGHRGRRGRAGGARGAVALRAPLAGRGGPRGAPPRATAGDRSNRWQKYCWTSSATGTPRGQTRHPLVTTGRRLTPARRRAGRNSAK